MHGARPGNAAHARKGRGDDAHAVMRLTFRAGAGMAGMAVAVIRDLDLGGREGSAKRGGDAIGTMGHAP